MMMTRSQTLAAATADTVTLSNSTSRVIVNKQTQVQTRSLHTLRSKRRSISSSPRTSSRRPRSRVAKKIFNKNNNVSGINLFVRSNSTNDARSSSSNSSSPSSTNSSRSSSSSSTISSSSSDSSLSSSTSLITKNLNKLKINNNNNSSSSTSTTTAPLTQLTDRLPQPGTIVVYRSNRNGIFLCLHGYTYEYVRTTNYKKVKWRCKEIRGTAKCGSKIYTTENIGSEQMPVYEYADSNMVYHSHDPDPDQQKVALFNFQLKNTAESNKSVPPTRLINQLATQMKLDDKQIATIPKPQTLCRKIHRVRSKTIPHIPRSIIFDIPDTFSMTSSGTKFIFFDHVYSQQTKRIIAFASPLQLQILFSSPLICLDRTFSIVPKTYKQLLIIQSIDAKNYEATPALYALLNDKKAYTYTLLFRALKSTAKEMKMNFSPSRIITDFEKSMITTMKKQFPKTTHQGCLFHLYQAMSKKLKKYGLSTYYKHNDDLHLFLKKIMAIVLLIPSLMDDAFEFLRNDYLKNKKLKKFTKSLSKFMLYVNKQWLKSEMRTMITFYDVEFKTNNWSESYNSALRRRGQQHHLSIWMLIELLISEETAVRMKHFHTLNGKIKYVNKAIRDDVLNINKKIIEFNQQLNDNQIELDDCLIALSTLIGLKYEKWRRERKKNKKRIKQDDVSDD